jgi:hypothetical protein
MPNLFLQYFSCWGGLSLNTTEPAISVSSSPALISVDKRRTNALLGDKKIVAIIDIKSIFADRLIKGGYSVSRHISESIVVPIVFEKSNVITAGHKSRSG